MATRRKIASVLTAIAAVGFAATAALHSTGLDSVVGLAGRGPSELRALAPALWIMFSIDLLVLSLILGAMAIWPSAKSRFVVAFAGLCPLGAAVLQLVYIGFIPPTAILLGIAALSFVAAALDPGRA